MPHAIEALRSQLVWCRLNHASRLVLHSQNIVTPMSQVISMLAYRKRLCPGPEQVVDLPVTCAWLRSQNEPSPRLL